MTRKKLFNLFLILIVGGLGGVLADNLLLPYLATVSPFSKIGFIHRAGNGTTIINPTERIVITENTAVEEAIDKVNPSLVVVQSYQNKQLINQGTGFIITSDGLIITAADLISSKTNYYLIFRDNSTSVAAQVIKRDLENNLALLKIEENNLPVVSLVDLEDLHLGQRIISVGLELIEEEINHFVSIGIIRSISDTTLRVNLTEENPLANGSPLVNVKGEIIGLNLVNWQGLVKIVPAERIKEFIGL